MKKQLAVCLLLLFVATGCYRDAVPAGGAAVKGPAAVPTPDYWPTNGWKTASPESQGMDSKLLAGSLDFVRGENLNVHSLMVVRNGYAVLDAYFHPFTEGILHETASTTKSFTSTLVGIAIDRGIFKTVMDPVLPIVGAGGGPADAVDLDDVLTMRSGLKCISDSTTPAAFNEFRHSRNWLGFITALPMENFPGSKFCYSNADSHLLSLALTKAAGRSAARFAEEHLFGPLGIQWYDWTADPQGNSIGYAELKLQPRDMAKLGLLFLQRGMWDGRRVVSAGWVDEAVRPHVKFPGEKLLDGYGYQWWASSTGFYTTRGRGGQFIAVFPELNMVVATTAGLSPGEQEKLAVLLQNYIIASVKSRGPLPEDSGKASALAAAVKAAALPASGKNHEAPFVRTGTLPMPLAGLLSSGKRYVLEKNPLDIAAVTVTFYADSTAARLGLELEDGQKLDLPVGLDGIPLEGRGRYGLPAYTRGNWISDRDFEIGFDEVANINRWRIVVTFGGETIVLDASATGVGDFRLKGSMVKAQ
jgi:CubicO group peptidase (beta-lactamase class C family)